MKKTLFTCVAIGLVSAAGLPAWGGTKAQPPADPPVLVIPARYAFVKAAMDIEAVRPIPIVCYGVGTNAMALNRWNAAAKAWDPMTMDDLKTGAGLGKPPLAAIMGTDVAAVASLADVTKDWAAKSAQIPSCDLVMLVNTMNEALHFTSAEWRWLADRFNLKMKDENDQRRRYGRYGPPDQNKKKKKGPLPAAAPAPSDVVVPRAETPAVAEKPEEAEAKPAAAPASDKPAEARATPAGDK